MQFYNSLCLTLLFASTVLAQESPKSEKWLPKTAPDHVLDFSRLSVGKTGVDGNTILLACPVYKSQNLIKQVTKITYATETRQRTVRVDGKDEVQDYTVQVPVTTNIEVPYRVKFPDGSIKLTVPIDQVRAWDLDGNVVAPQALKKRLEKPTHLLTFESDQQIDYQPMDPYFKSIFKQETLVLFIPPGASVSFANKTASDEVSEPEKPTSR